MSGTTHAVSGVAGSVEEGRFRGEPSMHVAAGELTATFLPELGMTGVSLRLPRPRAPGPPRRAAGAAGAAPRSACRCSPRGRTGWRSRRYRAAGVDVDLDGLPLGTDGNGLPIHGLLVGRPGWRVGRRATRARSGAASAPSIDVDAPAFPFPHRIEVAVSARDRRLTIDTTVDPDRAQPGAGRLRLASVPAPAGHTPAAAGTCGCRRATTSRSTSGVCPTGGEQAERGEADPIGRRTFDDLYRLGRERRPRAWSPTSRRSRCAPGRGYPYAQVWVPAGRPFAALEPMTAAPTASSTAPRRSSNRATRTPPRSRLDDRGNHHDDEGTATMSTPTTRRPRS